jgi:methyl-accepting chemotaxis protein
VEVLVERRAREMRARYRPKGLFAKLFRKNRLEKLLDKYWEEGLYSRSYTDRSEIFKRMVIAPSQQQIQETFKMMHKDKKEDILNCGACGYKSCEQMAVAIINGLNKPANCVQFVEIEKSLSNEKKAKQMLNDVLDHTLEEVNRSIEGIGALSDGINSTAEYVLSSASGIQRMVENVRSIHGTLEHNAETVMKLNQTSTEGKDSITQIGKLITDVSHQADELIEACRMVGDIAEETGILGMNAAIEAAHAGEAVGKGFAVVAGEIRKLAETSGRQAVQISKSLKDVKTLIDTSTSSSAQAQRQFDTIMSLVGAVKNEAASIKGAIDAQNEGGNQVLQSLDGMKNLITKIKDDSSGLLATGQTIIQDIASLKAM